MSTDKNVELLATIIDKYCECCDPTYELPYTHQELVDILYRVKHGHVLTSEEYLNLRMLLFDKGDDDNNTSGEVLFSGNYIDLKNKPFIPTKMIQLQDYNDIMNQLNKRMDELSEKDNELQEAIDINSNFVKAAEMIIDDGLKELEELIQACQLFEGEELSNVIKGILGELTWIETIRDDIIDGKVLSERDFTAEYDEFLSSIINGPDGLRGYINDVIAESIVDPGIPNNDEYNNTRLDSIGEALSKKVNVENGMGLSHNDFDNTYKNVIDDILSYTPKENQTHLQACIEQQVQNSVNEVTAKIDIAVENIYNESQNNMEAMREEIKKAKTDINAELETFENEVFETSMFYKGDGPTSITVGGLTKNSVLENKSVREILLDILCPFVAPSISAELVLAHPGSNGNLYKVGTIVEIKSIKAYTEKGSLPINRLIFKQKIGNIYSVLAVQKPGETEYFFKDNFDLTSSIDSNYFVVDAEDVDGNITTGTTSSIEFVYPIYYGSFDIGKSINENNVCSLQELLKRNGSNCSVKYTTQNQRMIFAVPTSYGNLSSIIDQNGYVITNSFDSELISIHFSVMTRTKNSYRASDIVQQYRVYYSTPNTVQQFEVSFNF